MSLPMMTVTAEETGMALLDFLTRRLNRSRRQAKALLDDRGVFVQGRRVWMARHRLKHGDVVNVVQATRAPLSDTPLPILHRDETLLAIDKPAGRVVIGANGIEAQLRRQMECDSIRAVHRLDRDTSGCLLFVWHPSALPPLIELFRRHAVVKVYDALVIGRIPFTQRTLRMPLDGLSAITHVHRMRSGHAVSHLEVRIETGRTHQIRRHLAAIGHPVLGDKQFGANVTQSLEQQKLTRQMLHAHRLMLAHPITAQPIEIVAPLPNDFIVALSKWKLRE